MSSRQAERDQDSSSEWYLSPDEDSGASEELLRWIAATSQREYDEVKEGVRTVYLKMHESQGCSYRSWLRWCEKRASYLFLLWPHSKEPERLSVRFFREAKSISSLSLARYQGSALDRRSAETAAAMFGGRVDSVSYPGEGHVIFNVTINLGIDVADTRSNIVAVPPIAEGRCRGISRLDSTALSSLIWLHSKAPESVSRFLTQSRPGNHHASDMFVRVLGDRKAMYRRAYANILGYMEGAARRQRLASLSIVTCDRPPASTRDQRETEARKSVIIRSAQVQRARCLILLSWISGVATIVLSSIYREELGTDVPAIVIAVITLNFIIATQAVVAQMTPEHNVFEVLRAKLTITPTRRSTLILYDEDAEDYLEMVVTKKRPEVLKRQGACFLRGSCDTGNVKLDGVRMNVTIPGLNRYITRDWIPIVAFAERTENMNGDQGPLASSPEQCTMLDFTTSSTSILHFLPAGNKRDTALTGLIWNSPVKAGRLEISGLRWNVSNSMDEEGSSELHRRVQRPTGWPMEDFRGAELGGVWFTGERLARKLEPFRALEDRIRDQPHQSMESAELSMSTRVTESMA